MAIIQISKIQQRSGDLVDLPQLDEAEFGFASDAKRLFIGKTEGNIENIEVLTSYSNISFSQIDGAFGNLDIANTVADGEILAYDGSNWVNRGGNAGGLITLGDASNVKLAGGSIGYVLETDGTGNLSWTSKGFLRTDIIAISNANPAIMTVASTTPYTNGTKITITSVEGANVNLVNGQDFWLTLDPDFANNGNAELYTDQARTVTFDGTNLSANANTGIATATISAGGGSGAAQGANFSIQYNDGGLLEGDSNLTWDFGNAIFTVTGTANITGNLTSGNANLGNLARANFANVVSNVVAGNVYANSGTVGASLLAGTLTTAAQPNVTSLGNGTQITAAGNLNPNANVTYSLGNNTNRWNNLWLSGSTIYLGNATITSNASGVVITNASGGSFTVGGASAANGAAIVNGNSNVIVTANANVNISSNGVANVLVVTSTGANIAGTLRATGNANVGNIGATNANITALTATGNANVGNLGATRGVFTNIVGTLETAAQPNITSIGTLSSLSVSGNVTAGNLNTTAGRVGGASATILGTALTTGANTTAGTITGNWTLSSGSRLQSTYADLAEYYCADGHYIIGTVLEFGGEYEVTLAGIETNKVAGVVSDKPAYVMNTQIDCRYPTPIALQGRVPCKVVGKVRKGDMMISAGNGFAKAAITEPRMGTVIGKALADFDGQEGVIEVAIGRL